MLQALTPFFAVIAVVILGTDRRIVRTLRDSGALSPGGAIALPRRNLIWRWRMRRLLGRGAIARVDGTGGIYLDETRWQAFRAWRRRRAVIVIAIVVALFLAFTFLSSRLYWFSSDV